MLFDLVSDEGVVLICRRLVNLSCNDMLVALFKTSLSVNAILKLNVLFYITFLKSPKCVCLLEPFKNAVS